MAAALLDDPAWGLRALHNADIPAHAGFLDRVRCVPLVDLVQADQTLGATCMAPQLQAGGGQAGARIKAALDVHTS